jgi:hypothetical protein
MLRFVLPSSQPLAPSPSARTSRPRSQQYRGQLRVLAGFISCPTGLVISNTLDHKKIAISPQ